MGDMIDRDAVLRIIALCSAESDSPNAHYVCKEAIKRIRAAPAEDVRAGARIIPMHTQSMYGVCIGGRWDGWVMVKHPDGYWVSHNKPDPIDPAATFNLIPGAKP